ncbi:MAG: succinate dehydrogenase, cytochrome b556 subunit [Thiobacillaceae bacterium]|jgi:succinate dehydrogenase / fumarate reductase cytochrome b subunit|nr:succinate dehydrogenase, cytochrome b556 subunit [Thiobacillaceae bacterium]
MAARPVWLNPLRMRLPIGGWVSILHRASGVLLCLAVPALLYALMLSLRSPADFAAVAAFLGGGIGFLFVLALIWASLHHLFAGLRHLALDLGWGEARGDARRTAWLSLIAALVLTGALGAWIG